MNKSYVSIVLCLLTNSCFALSCPTNFSIINIGESIVSVAQQCGKPNSEKKYEAKMEGPQEWTYFMTETVATSTSYSTTGTLKTTFTFDKDDNAINISVNGIGVGETTICGSSVRLGYTRDQVKGICGQPSFINKQTNESGKEEMDTIVEYNYNSNPPVTLVFKNGILTGTK